MMDKMTADMRAHLQRGAAMKTWLELTEPQRRLACEIAASPGGEMVVPGTRGATAKVLRQRGVVALLRHPSVHIVVGEFVDLARPKVQP